MLVIGSLRNNFSVKLKFLNKSGKKLNTLFSWYLLGMVHGFAGAGNQLILGIVPCK